MAHIPYSEKKFEANDVLFQEGEQSYHFYIIKNGKVGVFKHNNEGGAVPLAVVGPGEALGELAMIDRAPRSAMALALTPVEAVVVTEQGVNDLLSDLPEWATSIMSILVSRLRRMNNILVKHGIYDTESESEIELAKQQSEITKTVAGILYKELENRKNK